MRVKNEILSQWLDQELANVLGFPATSEITSYILSMDTFDEQEQHLREMLDPSDPRHSRLILEFREKLRDQVEQPNSIPGITVYKKKSNRVEEFVPVKVKSSSHNKEKTSSTMPSESNSDISNKKSTKKFVSIYSKDGQAKDAMTLQGRHVCECQTAKHDLVNNCTKCGRIVCAQEGSGPCFFCGNLVCTKAEMEVLSRGSKKSESLLKKLVGDQKESSSNQAETFRTTEALTKAEQHKNKLLEYDENSEKRTQVIDDESDYFSVDTDKWLTKDQRLKLQKREKEIRDQRHGSRLDRKITFDFAGRKVVEEDHGMVNYDPTQDIIVKEIYEGKKNEGFENSYQEAHRKALTDFQDLVNPNIKVPRPMLSNDEPGKLKDNQANYAKVTSMNKRLQDAPLQEMRDDGNCLSMHQPFASLLTLGIKKHEGRTWYSSVRGRLWIHAGSKVPSEAEIEEVKQFYKMYYNSESIKFPTTFPTSCLLGCVDVEDCLSQEDYREKFPNGESSSAYVFVCKNPQELLLKFPMSGEHKIYKLDPNIHQAAKKAAKRSEF